MSHWTRFVRFNGVSAAGIVVQLGTVTALTGLAGTDTIVATVGGVSAAVVHNFLWHRRWTWADRRRSGVGGLATFLRFATANGAVSMFGNLVIVLILTSALKWHAVIANAVAIVVCGIANYALADRLVFAGDRALTSSALRISGPTRSD